MQVRPVLFTILIALGFALLANSWVVKDVRDEAPPKTSLSGLNPTLSLPRIPTKADTFEVPPPPTVEYDTLDVSTGIQDLVLVARIKKQLFKNETLREEEISVVAVKGEVTIEGQVASLQSKELIERTIKRINGVLALESQLEYQ